jgi:predicted RNA binding protein YcfA (HicA-like mRNA interferase family)
VSVWPSVKAKVVLRALLRIGWRVKRQIGTSHRVLERDGWADYVFHFHGGEELGPVMLAKIAKKTGLTPEAL